MYPKVSDLHEKCSEKEGSVGFGWRKEERHRGITECAKPRNNAMHKGIQVKLYKCILLFFPNYTPAFLSDYHVAQSGSRIILACSAAGLVWN